ncbi:MAG TPA: DNA polymerase IV, partial [Gemmatimonadaceae bacterium]|nr:DNA polymerase IV [Gemmatimonadaceae bacterium]
MPPRRILLVDVDAFFVAVARLVDPDGAGKEPFLLVGGSASGRGVVCSASYETRRFGVRSAMPMARAMALCPGAVRVPVPGKACAAKSKEIRAILGRLSPVVEGASIDEWYLDLAGTEALFHHEPLIDSARRIRTTIRDETGLTVSIGGATSKLLAKMAAEKAKPKPGTGATGVCIVPVGGEAEFLRGLELGDIPLIGPKFQARLAHLGFRTIADVLAVEPAELATRLGERQAAWVLDRAHGIDERRVRQRDLARSISRDETFSKDLSADADLERELLRLVARAASDLRHDGLAARTITV